MLMFKSITYYTREVLPLESNLQLAYEPIPHYQLIEPGDEVTKERHESGSPDGSSVTNAALAQKRAEMLKTYILSNYGIKPELLRVNWIAEDWALLRTLVEEACNSTKKR